MQLPMELVKVALEIGTKFPQIANDEHLKKIDFQQVLALVEQGAIGKLVEIESADGEIIRVIVESS